MIRLSVLLVLLSLTHLVVGQTGKVIINVEAIDAKKGGELSAGIFNEGNFPKVGKQLRGLELPVNGSNMQIIFKDVRIGNYGVVVFHDIDKNKDLKTNIVGFPQEPIGFSNDARIKFGPPSFNDAKVTVEKDKELIIKIILR